MDRSSESRGIVAVDVGVLDPDLERIAEVLSSESMLLNDRLRECETACLSFFTEPIRGTRDATDDVIEKGSVMAEASFGSLQAILNAILITTCFAPADVS